MSDRSPPVAAPGESLPAVLHALRQTGEDGSARRSAHRLLETVLANDLSIKAMQVRSHGMSFVSGWYHDPGTGALREANVGEKLMLIVSEVAEAMEAHRKGLFDGHLPHRPGIEVELADALIRIFDLGGCLGLDLQGAVLEKLAYNARRQDHDPAVRAAGGKAY